MIYFVAHHDAPPRAGASQRKVAMGRPGRPTSYSHRRFRVRPGPPRRWQRCATHRRTRRSTRAFGACECDPPLLSKTDPGGLWQSLEGQITLLQIAVPGGDRRRFSKIGKTSICKTLRR